jgi:hypothetical protein
MQVISAKKGKGTNGDTYIGEFDFTNLTAANEGRTFIFLPSFDCGTIA